MYICNDQLGVIISFYVYSDLAIEVSTNATALRQLITDLLKQQQELGDSINRTNLVVDNAENALQEVS